MYKPGSMPDLHLERFTRSSIGNPALPDRPMAGGRAAALPHNWSSARGNVSTQTTGSMVITVSYSPPISVVAVAPCSPSRGRPLGSVICMVNPTLGQDRMVSGSRQCHEECLGRVMNPAVRATVVPGCEGSGCRYVNASTGDNQDLVLNSQK